MIRKTAIGLVLVAAWAGAPSAAHAAPPANFAVNGSVPSHCSLGTSPGPITISTTVPNNGKLDPALNGESFTLDGVFCAAPSTITVSATALRRSPPKTSVPNGQSQAVNFTATATGWTTPAATVTTAEVSSIGTPTVFTGIPRSQGSAKAASITVTVNNFTTVLGSNGKSQKLVDGAYSATVTVSLTPAS